jgi:hypothetical protein
VTAAVVDPLDAIAQAQAALAGVAEALRKNGAVDRAQELEHAEIYAASAALFRRRAANRNDPELQSTLGARAAWYEGRARAKREGMRMPREFRTPAESLETVDRMRRAIAELCLQFSDVTVDELRAFAEACEGEHPDPQCSELADAIERLAERVGDLGVRLSERVVEDYRRPTLDGLPQEAE